MTYTLFLFQIISFKKYFYVFLGNNFFTVFRGRTLVVEAPGQLLSLPTYKSGLASTAAHDSATTVSTHTHTHTPQACAAAVNN